jgi:hypothetical protein
MWLRRSCLVALIVVLLRGPSCAGEGPARDEAIGALRKAVAFFHGEVATRGGYVYRTSGDLTLREAEGVTGPATIWVQPPGTPAVAEAFLDAFEATGEAIHLDAARDAARALVLGQLHSGGWHYRIEFDPDRRRDFSYRRDLDGRPLPDPTAPADRATAAGWDVWRRRHYEKDQTILDDDTTQAALRVLMRIDRVLEFRDDAIHEAAGYARQSLRTAQYPCGAWSANFDRFPERSPSAEDYPPARASYPTEWSRTWTKDFRGCYVLNDNLLANMIATMLRAWEIYGDARDLAAAERAGVFLLLAQMPDPQPAWAQQYDREMHPVWDRAFEPPALSGRESQTALEALLLLHRRTGNPQFLAPLPRAIAYLRRSQLPDGRLSRFYELQTNRPLYFTRGPDGKHEMTYGRDRLATNYGFLVDSRLDAIEAEYHRLLSAGPEDRDRAGAGAVPPMPSELADRARAVIAGLDARGAWVERGRLTHHKLEPASGIIDSGTFAENVKVLARFLAASK